MQEEPTFFHPSSEIDFSKNRLPHWEQVGATYFVTFRLFDSLPQSVLKEAIQRELKSESDDLLEAQKDRLKIRENLLDNGIGECQLRDPIVRQEVLKVVQTMPTKVWTLVIMPNHLHCLISLNESRTLSSTLQTLKGISARRVNQKLKRSGSFWAKDYFDRIVRDRSHFFRCARYIRRNPQKAALGTTEFTLWESGYVSKLLTGAR